MITVMLACVYTYVHVRQHVLACIHGPACGLRCWVAQRKGESKANVAASRGVTLAVAIVALHCAHEETLPPPALGCEGFGFGPIKQGSRHKPARVESHGCLEHLLDVATFSRRRHLPIRRAIHLNAHGSTVHLCMFRICNC